MSALPVSRKLPRSFVLELTRRCNNRCVYCYLSGGVAAPDSARARAEEMSATAISALIAELRREVPLQSLALSGGETLLRDDLPQILAYLRTLGIQIVVITNGTLLTPEKIAATKDGVTYEITLLSHRSAVHDNMVKHPGAWDKVVTNMTHVRRARGNFVAVFIATRLNSADLRKTVELAIALGAGALMYNRMNLSAHNFPHAAELLPAPDMIRANLDTLEEMSEKYNLPVAVSVAIEPCVIDLTPYRHIHFGWCPLAGEDAYFTIDPQGNLRVCNHSPVILGNLRTESFTSIYNNHPYLRSFRESLPEECVACRPDLRAMCCGGCKAAAEQCYGAFNRVDPFVTICTQAAPAR